MARPNFTEIEQMGNSCQSRNGVKPNLWLLHTQEGNGTAQSLAAYLNNPANSASYHYVGSDTTVVDVVDTDLASWSVLDANARSINFCFAGSRASWTRQQWLDNAGQMIDIAAYLAVQDCRKYGIPMVVLGTGGNYKSGGAGIADHQYVTNVLGIGTHTDVGRGFPTDVFAAAVAKYAGQDSAPVVNQIDQEATRARAWIGNRITKGENICPDKFGRWAAFEHAHIYWHPTTGAHAIPHGGLFEAFGEYGYEAGILRYPTLDHAVVPDGGVQAFQGAVLYRKNGSEHGYFVGGEILKRYAALGYEAGELGWPTSNEVDYDGGRVQTFEHGHLYWHPSSVVRLK